MRRASINKPVIVAVLALLMAAYIVAGCAEEIGPLTGSDPGTSGSSTTSGPSTTTETVSTEGSTTTDTKVELPTTLSSLAMGSGLTPEQVRNAQILVEDQAGLLELQTAAEDPAAFGDLSGDGLDDAALVMRAREEAGGGDGEGSQYVVALLWQDGEIAQGGHYALGAGTRVDSLAVEDGRVVVEAAVPGPEDPSGTPRVPIVVRLGLPLDPFFSPMLVLRSQTSETPGGDLREISITSPEAEAMVVGLVEIAGTVTIAPFENNLAYHVYDTAMIEVGSGPVMVDAPDMGAPGTFVFALDLLALGCNGQIFVTVSDLSAADGSVLALDSIDLVNAAPT